MPPIDIACVIHGDAYPTDYAVKLYNMVSRHLPNGIRFHVYTEADRELPESWIRHTLPDYLLRQPGWWAKMAIFNPEYHAGPMLYLDLDVVIVNQLHWITTLPTKNLWAIRDYRKLWQPDCNTYNSSAMWFDTTIQHKLWDEFAANPEAVITRFRGDQDYITAKIPQGERRFLDEGSVLSWKWQAYKGGWDTIKKQYRHMRGTTDISRASILVFHGDPKPHEVDCPVIRRHWA